MAAAFDTWTVLPHDPLEKLAENLWTVTGMLKTAQRRMVVARLRDGRLVVHNAIALEDAGMAELDAWGPVAAIVVPNAYHRQDAKIWKDRYPNAKVYCPRGATKGVAKVVPVDGDYDAAPSDDTVKLVHLDGMKLGEGVLEVRSAEGVTVVFNDAVMNIPKAGGPMGFFLAPTGVPAVPRVMRWMGVKDKLAFTAHLERIASTPGLVRVLMSHGKPFSPPADQLRAAIATV